GERDDCGHDFAQHALGYLTALKAWSEVELEHYHHGEAGGVEQERHLHSHWRHQFELDHPCRHQATPTA
ncbi:hypothetical protein, partial [Phyllobacterium calauticae]|uniref:hypothetical protein n=1 Tax=Phyllobacterium calauticae TaxID=2817027 RepID=UPI001CBFBB5B